jgi:parallel beta-helix repeat protein
MKKILLTAILLIGTLTVFAQSARRHDYDPATRGVFNVLDYGADPTGATESTTSIQAALNACDSGTVYIPQGYYLTGTLIIPNDNVTIKGAGKYLTTLQLKDDADMGSACGNLINVLGKHNFEISDIALDGNKLNQTKIDTRDGVPNATSSGIFARDTVAYQGTNNFYVHDCYIYDFAKTGIIWSGNDDTEAQISHNAVIINCQFIDNGWSGFEFYGYTENGTVQDCFFDGNAAGSFYGNNCKFVGNVVYEIWNANHWISSYPYALTLEGGTLQKNIEIKNCVFMAKEMGSAIYSLNGADSTTIENVKISGSNTQDCVGILMLHDIATIINNVTIYFPHSKAEIGIWMNGSVNATLTNIQILDAEYGIYFSDNANNNNVLNNDIRCEVRAVSIASGCTYNVVANNILYSEDNSGDHTELYDLGTLNVHLNNYSTSDDAMLSNYATSNIGVTATSNGLTTGLILRGSQNITVTSASANNICSLPTTDATTIGQVITGQVGANGFELRVIAAQATTVYINGVTTNVEAAIPANSSFEIRCVDATHWILKAWTALGAEITAIVPDAFE